jgi:hypothetical protein
MPVTKAKLERLSNQEALQLKARMLVEEAIAEVTKMVSYYIFVSIVS